MLRRPLLQCCYCFDIRVAVVLLLFVLYSWAMYKYVMRGYTQYEEHLHLDKYNKTAMQDDVLLLGPMYSFLVHYPHFWRAKEGTSSLESMTLDAAKTDVLILAYAHDGDDSQDRMEVVDYFSRTQRWSLVLSLENFQSYNQCVFNVLPAQNLPLTMYVDTPYLVIVRLRNISSFSEIELLGQSFLPADDHRSVAVCFLVGQDPTHVSGLSERNQEGEFFAGFEWLRIFSMVAHWGRAHGVSWVFFVSSCPQNVVHFWEKNNSTLFGNFTAWWVCAKSDTFIEVNPASQLLTVLSEDQ